MEGSGVKLNLSERTALERAKRWRMGSPTATYMPYRSEARTFSKLADRGAVEWLEHNPPAGIQYSGYALTEVGEKALDAAP